MIIKFFNYKHLKTNIQDDFKNQNRNKIKRNNSFRC